MVNSGPFQLGAAWFQQPFNLTSGFYIQFDTRISNNTANDTTTGSANAFQYNKPGDGFAFVAQQDSDACDALGIAGAGIGYHGITNAVVVEFDVYNNPINADPSADHLAVQASPTFGDTVSSDHASG